MPLPRALTLPLAPLSDPQKARASSDGMGRAAAAGTGLLANVVAGVGSAIGATRSGTEGEYFAGGGGASGGIGIGGRGGNGAASLVQLYRRTDADEPSGRAEAPAATATMHTSLSTSFGSSHNIGNSTGVLSERESAEAVLGKSNSSKKSSLNAFSADTIDAAGEGGGVERRSALGEASATGGTMLRGLWGGVQSAAAAGVAVARQGGSAGDGASGGADVQPSSEFRLYRREGDL